MLHEEVCHRVFRGFVQMASSTMPEIMSSAALTMPTPPAIVRPARKAYPDMINRGIEAPQMAAMPSRTRKKSFQLQVPSAFALSYACLPTQSSMSSLIRSTRSATYDCLGRGLGKDHCENRRIPRLGR